MDPINPLKCLIHKGFEHEDSRHDLVERIQIDYFTYDKYFN